MIAAEDGGRTVTSLLRFYGKFHHLLSIYLVDFFKEQVKGVAFLNSHHNILNLNGDDIEWIDKVCKTTDCLC